VPSVAKWIRLGPDASRTRTLSPTVRVQLASSRLAVIRRSSRVVVRVTSKGAARVAIRAGSRKAPGRTSRVVFRRGGTKVRTLALTAAAVRALGRERTPMLWLRVKATSRAGTKMQAVLSEQLKGPAQSGPGHPAGP
jgi:hypothetical protein